MSATKEKPGTTTWPDNIPESAVEDMRGVKRYQLVLPNALYAKVQQAAEERDVTVVQLLRSFIKIGLTVIDAENDPDGALILRTEGTEKHLVLL